MPNVTFKTADGGVLSIEAAVGQTLMEVATSAGVPGILAECGGACMCATCHVYVDEHWTDRVGPANDDEEAMLEDAASNRELSSRLSCQIRLSSQLDGLVVQVARNGL